MSKEIKKYDFPLIGEINLLKSVNKKEKKEFGEYYLTGKNNEKIIWNCSSLREVEIKLTKYFQNQRDKYLEEAGILENLGLHIVYNGLEKGLEKYIKNQTLEIKSREEI